MSEFDPNSAAAADGVFGLPFSEEEASLVFLPVPWEATVSYGEGAVNGPKAILQASYQVDLFDPDVLRPYEAGLFMMPESNLVREWNASARNDAKHVIETRSAKDALDRVNRLGENLNQYVFEQTQRCLKAGKIIGVVGGDHSVPFGALTAVAESVPSFGILHLDAHLDTRKAYEGFTWSHASIMYNVLEENSSVRKLVQVGIRDFCEEELEYCRSQGTRVRIFFDQYLSRQKFEGVPWATVCDEIVSSLPERVWISFDIDGLDPRFCPSTGTPVPGGLDFQQANYLLGVLVRSGKKIIGFDLSEVACLPSRGDWDANVGARLLYKLSAWTLASQGKAEVHIL